MLSEDKSAEVINLVSRLIRARSYSGEEREVAGILSSAMMDAGFNDVTTDRYGNVIGRLAGSRPGPKILFDGHMDTVPVPDSSVWTHDPFGAQIEGGRMYGRGTSDMKGALGSMVCAAKNFREATGGDFAGEVYVAGVVHEECFEGVASREISKAVRPDVVVIGEASNLDVKIGQRGRAEVVVRTHGKSCHSANPEKGLNAVYAMTKVVDAIRKLVPPEQPKLGKGILELTDIISNPYPGASVVPDLCRVTYDRRLLVGETPESVLAPIQEALDALMAKDPEVKADVSYSTGSQKCYTGETISAERFFPGWLYDEGEPFVQSVVGELRGMGFAPQIREYNFCTNGSHYAGEAHIPTIGLGPSVESLAHVVDEYVELSQLTGVTECYEGAMRALCK